MRITFVSEKNYINFEGNLKSIDMPLLDFQFGHLVENVLKSTIKIL